ncbi:MAG: hypothetical protein IPL28_22355 [Chloroflexi bacterium]|nr:hypothetical protein [Chloroflexota bacterium]
MIWAVITWMALSTPSRLAQPLRRPVHRPGAKRRHLRGQGYPVYQWLPSGLNNTGETIRLLTGAGFVVDEVPYQSSAPWPTAPNGNASSAS